MSLNQFITWFRVGSCCVSSVSLDPSAIGDTSVGSIIGGGTDAFLDCMIGNSTVLTMPLFITVVG